MRTMSRSEGEARFFATPAAFRRWLAANHAKADALWVGFRKVGTGKPSVTWPQTVDEALCFGWIDGKRQRIDEESYRIRFSPRKKGSRWSAVNVRNAQRLERAGRMTVAGRAAFGDRSSRRTAKASYEQGDRAKLDPASARKLKADGAVWAFFSAQTPSYQRAAAWWVVSAKREETRARRLGLLIEHSRAGRKVPPLTPPG